MNRETGVGLLTLVVLSCAALPAAAEQKMKTFRNWECAIDYAPPFTETPDSTTTFTSDSILTCSGPKMHIRCKSTLPPAIRDTLGFRNKRTYKDFPCRIQGTLCGSQNKLASDSHLTVNGKTGRAKLHCNTRWSKLNQKGSGVRVGVEEFARSE